MFTTLDVIFIVSAISVAVSFVYFAASAQEWKEASEEYRVVKKTLRKVLRALR